MLSTLKGNTKPCSSYFQLFDVKNCRIKNITTDRAGGMLRPP